MTDTTKITISITEYKALLQVAFASVRYASTHRIESKLDRESMIDAMNKLRQQGIYPGLVELAIRTQHS